MVTKNVNVKKKKPNSPWKPAVFSLDDKEFLTFIQVLNPRQEGLLVNIIPYILFFELHSFFFSFSFFRAETAAYRSSQARC